MAGKKTGFRVSDRQISSLRRRIQKSGGTAILLVHPYFFYNTFSLEDMKSIDPDRRYESGLKIILSQQKSPVIIMEEHFQVKQLHERLSAQRTGVSLIMPTGSNTSAPLIKIEGEKEELDFERKKLMELLERAGAKTVLVGGMFADEPVDTHQLKTKTRDAEIRWQNSIANEKYFTREGAYSQNSLTQGCAGKTYRFLVESGKFKVRWIGRVMLPNHKIIVSRKKIYRRPYVNPRQQKRLNP